MFGASGTGTTTLGHALASALGVPAFDTDRYFWMPTDPPFQQIRPLNERLDLLSCDMRRHGSWISSGSLCGWGDSLAARFDGAVFLTLNRDIRMARLVHRERERYGTAALKPGGAMHEQHRAFLDWAADYDDGGLEIRSRVGHESWIGTLRCPVLRLDSEATVADNLEAIIRWM